MLADTTRESLQEQVLLWKSRLSQYGLRLNLNKTEYLETNRTTYTIEVDGSKLNKTNCFRYLGSRLSSDGGMENEIRARIKATWMRWRGVTGVLCDKRMPICLKSLICMTIVPPVALYGAECWPTTKTTEQKLHVMEIRMLRWTLGFTRLDRIRNTSSDRRGFMVSI